MHHIGREQPLIGGETTGWRVWMPPRAMCTAEDATVMYSPAFYRRHIRPHDRRLTDAFGAYMFEVHHEGEHQFGEFGDLPGAGLLTIESFRRMAPAHREALRSLLGRKYFLFSVQLDEVDELLAFTGTRGVMLSLSAPDLPAAKRILGELERATGRSGPSGP